MSTGSSHHNDTNGITKRHISHLPSPMPSPPRSCSPTNNASVTATAAALLLDKGMEPLLLTTKHDLLPEKKINPLPILALIQKYISELEGRDKSIKVIQYAFKVLLHYRLVDAKRWATMVSQFSQTRKLLRVGHWVGTVRDIKQQYDARSTSLFRWFTLLITLGNEVADDIFCFYKMGAVNPSIGKKAEKVSIYCWFIGIWIDMKSNLLSLRKLVNQENPTLQHKQQIFLARISCTKLLMDGIFCACDIWEPSFSPGVQAWSGFFSGSLSGYKLWCKTKAASSPAL